MVVATGGDVISMPVVIGLAVVAKSIVLESLGAVVFTWVVWEGFCVDVMVVDGRLGVVRIRGVVIEINSSSPDPSPEISPEISSVTSPEASPEVSPEPSIEVVVEGGLVGRV